MHFRAPRSFCGNIYLLLSLSMKKISFGSIAGLLKAMSEAFTATASNHLVCPFTFRVLSWMLSSACSSVAFHFSIRTEPSSQVESAVALSCSTISLLKKIHAFSVFSLCSARKFSGHLPFARKICSNFMLYLFLSVILLPASNIEQRPRLYLFYHVLHNFSTFLSSLKRLLAGCILIHPASIVQNYLHIDLTTFFCLYQADP